MDAVNDPLIEDVIVMSSAQIGKTEILNNIVGYYMEHDPCSILFLQPTLDMARTWSKQRFTPMLRDTPSLSRLVSLETRDKDNTILEKNFPGGFIAMAGANSPASLASRPIRIVICDEVDRYPPSAGEEGDTIDLAKKRTTTFWNRKSIVVSTPTIRGVSRIEFEYEYSDKRVYHVPCLKCGHKQQLIFAQLKWQKNEAGHISSVWYECNKCAHKHMEKDKYKMILNGEWIKTNPDILKRAGFHLSELYSTLSTWQRVVESFLKSKERPETLKVWTNTTLGETWEEEGQKFDTEILETRREDYNYSSLPEDIYLLTAGVDVQQDRLHLLIYGWGLEMEKWIVRYQVIYGDPAEKRIWAKLDEKLEELYSTRKGRKLPITITCIDTGGSNTKDVYEYVKPRQEYRIYGVKGKAGSDVSYLVLTPSHSSKIPISLYILGVDKLKDVIYNHLNISEPGPGYIHIPMWADTTFFNELTAEKKVKKYIKGRPVFEWKQIRERNEALDCSVYATAAYIILNPDMDSLKEQAEEYEEKQGNPPAQPDNFVVNFF